MAANASFGVATFGAAGIGGTLVPPEPEAAAIVSALSGLLPLIGGACFGGLPRLGATARPGTIEEAVAAALASSQAVAELVEERIHPDDRPAWMRLDALVFSITTDTPDKSLDGSTGVNVARVDCEGQSLSRRSARLISEAAVAALSAIERRTVGGVFISTVVHDQDSEAYVDQGNGSTTPYRWHSPELLIRYRLV